MQGIMHQENVFPLGLDGGSWHVWQAWDAWRHNRQLARSSRIYHFPQSLSHKKVFPQISDSLLYLANVFPQPNRNPLHWVSTSSL
jgi:hypothetical protein